MPYRPYFIGPLKTALSIGVEDWLSLPDAFSTLINMRVNKFVLEKRPGFSPFAQMKHGTTLQTATSITGICTYLRNGIPNLLVMDSKGSPGSYTGRCNLYDPVDDSMTDISSDLTTPVDIFTGSPSRFFHFANWLGVGYMTNNKDQIHKWEGRGSAVVPFNIQINTDAKTNHVNTCRYIFIKDDRLVLLDTVEFGDWVPQRCRFSPVLQTDFSAAGSGYVDAPTQQRISAAGMIGKNIAVYMEGDGVGSLWLIKSTGRPDVPFKWEKIEDIGSPAPYSGVKFRNGLAAVGLSNVIFTDGFQVKPIDLPHARDILTKFNNDYIRSVFGHHQNERDQQHLLFTFAGSSSSAIDEILDYNKVENNWTIHKSGQSFFVNIIGGFTGQKRPKMSDVDIVAASAGAAVSEIHIDSRAVLGAPAPYTLIGCRNSRLYTWGDGEYDGTDDANGKIEIEAGSIPLNPFIKNGRKVACSKIGLFVDNDANASFLASVYKNTSSTAYKTKTISCDGFNDKFWAWIFCDGEVGDFHRLKISHTERGNSPKIHAIMPYFEPAGELWL